MTIVVIFRLPQSKSNSHRAECQILNLHCPLNIISVILIPSKQYIAVKKTVRLLKAHRKLGVSVRKLWISVPPEPALNALSQI